MVRQWAMNGTNALDGTPLSGIDHLKQSVRDILTTPKGSRVMRREYGSNLPFLVDAPINRGTITAIVRETVEALSKWEPRIAVSNVTVVTAEPGAVTLDITGTYKPDGKTITLEGVIVQ
jgi:phage baseplate assembly protein W